MDTKKYQNFLFIFILFISLISCNNFPKDPQDSWKHAKAEGLKVGVVDHPPFAMAKKDSFSGSEVKMIREFASQNDLQVKFESGNETELVDKMEHYKLHVIIGGFTKKTVWKKKIAPTIPYNKQKHVFLVPKGENKLMTHLETYLYQIKNRHEKS
ncbi:MAG: transporter substrate-binding domain-containing protein [Gillisia sp.]